jgi:hypothetical protein
MTATYGPDASDGAPVASLATADAFLIDPGTGGRMGATQTDRCHNRVHHSGITQPPAIPSPVSGAASLAPAARRACASNATADTRAACRSRDARVRQLA